MPVSTRMAPRTLSAAPAAAARLLLGCTPTETSTTSAVRAKSASATTSRRSPSGCTTPMIRLAACVCVGPGDERESEASARATNRASAAYGELQLPRGRRRLEGRSARDLEHLTALYCRSRAPPAPAPLRPAGSAPRAPATTPQWMHFQPAEVAHFSSGLESGAPGGFLARSRLGSADRDSEKIKVPLPTPRSGA